MESTVLKVPGSLLLDRHLANSAKFLWIILQGIRSDHTPVSTGQLKARSGLARHTVVRGLTQLERAGWLPNHDDTNPQGWASVPRDLLLDPRPRLMAKLMFGTLQLIPGFRGQTGQFTYAELGHRLNLHPSTVKHAIRSLQATDWLQVSKEGKFRPVLFALRNPAAERRAVEVLAVRRRLEEAAFVGEALMREFLTLIVDSDEFEDNATPGFLVNPYTGEEMQFDRYYPPNVAFEFNGPQHYGPTARYTNEADVRKQQGRDYIKVGISKARGISLVVVHFDNLTLAGIRQKVDGLLPLRDLGGFEAIVGYLEFVSRAYRRKARQGRSYR